MGNPNQSFAADRGPDLKAGASVVIRVAFLFLTTTLRSCYNNCETSKSKEQVSRWLGDGLHNGWHLIASIQNGGIIGGGKVEP